jgi:hypothetical protein
MSYYLDIIYNRKTNDFNASENKIKKETNDYLNTIRKKKNKLRIVGDLQPMAPSNQIASNNTNDDKKIIIPNIESKDSLKLIEYIDNLSNKQDNIIQNNENYKKNFEYEFELYKMKEKLREQSMQNNMELLNEKNRQIEENYKKEKELKEEYDKMMNDKKMKNKSKKIN